MGGEEKVQENLGLWSSKIVCPQGFTPAWGWFIESRRAVGKVRAGFPMPAERTGG